MSEDIIEDYWQLTEGERTFVSKCKGFNRLQCAILLKFFQKDGCFPKKLSDIPFKAMQSLSTQLGFPVQERLSYNYDDRTSERQRQDIRNFLGFRLPEKPDYDLVEQWLVNHVEGPEDRLRLHECLKIWFKSQQIELPVVMQQERIVNSVLASFEEQLARKISSSLSDRTKEGIDRLLVPNTGKETDGTTSPFSLLKSDPGKPALNSVFTELAKLAEIDALNLPSGLFDGVSQKTLHLYRSRAGTESIRDMRRHPDHIRYTLAAAFCHERRQEIIDGLIELLIQIVHKIRVRAEKKVIKELVNGVST